MSALCTTVVLLVLVFVYGKYVKKNVYESIENSLRSVSETSVQAVYSWSKGEMLAATYWASSKEIAHHAQKLLGVKNSQRRNLAEELRRHSSQREIRKILSEVLELRNYRGYFIVSPDYINLASSRDINIGADSLLLNNKGQFEKVLKGEMTLSNPLISDVPLSEALSNNLDLQMSMFSLAPLRDEKNKVIAVFAFRIDPESDFTELLRRGRIGETGETYAFNQSGIMLSNSRFISELKQRKLISPQENSTIGKIAIKIPNNLQDISARGADIFKYKYLDYRGVSVLGVWKWISHLELGVTTEIDEDEAFEIYQKNIFVLWVIVSLSVLLIWLGHFLIYTSQKKTFAYSQLLREFNEDLEKKVRERTKEVELANRAKSTFLANMGHEIRTPLTAILGHGEDLLDADLKAEEKRAVINIVKNGKFLLSIVSDILDFTEIESSNLVLEKKTFHLGELLEEISSRMESALRDKNVVLNIQINMGEKQHFIGDPIRLKTILLNLVGNAIKFTETGTIEVKVKSVQNGEMVLFEVVDSGIGLTEEKLLNVFNPFIQGDSTSTKVYGGTGLGLAISSQYVELMKGEMGASSTVGTGSCFWFKIPLDMVAEHSVQSARNIQAFGPQALEKLSFLIAEDNKMNLKLIINRLEGIGISRNNITTVENGKMAMDVAIAGEIDIIFMDCMMPLMDGVSATEKINAILGENAPYIIAITANVLREDREKYISAGMKDIIAKPFKKEDFYLAMNRFFTYKESK